MAKKIKAEAWGNDDLLGPFKRGTKELDWGGLGGWDSGSIMSCYDGHPVIVFPHAGSGVLVGGSCLHPSVKDADVYIGFASGMKHTVRSYPWTEGREFQFDITDGQAPPDAAVFSDLVDWTIRELLDGRKVHAGCVGGHGRTGTFIVAVVSRMIPEEKNAIKFVRESYCHKAVESPAQVEFLVQHFGVKKADPSGWSHSKKKGGKKMTTFHEVALHESVQRTGSFETGPPTYGHGNVWGRQSQGGQDAN